MPGRSVFVYWPLEKQWFQGAIDRVYADGNVRTVYPDGDCTKGGDLVLPAIDIREPVVFNHFSWGSSRPRKDRVFYHLSDDYPCIWEHSFVAMKGPDQGQQLVAYVVRFCKDDDGTIRSFEGVWVYLFEEIANNSFTLASVYTSDASDPTHEWISIPGFNDRPDRVLVRASPVTSVFVRCTYSIYAWQVALGSEGFTSDVRCIERPVSVVPLLLFREGLDDFAYKVSFVVHIVVGVH